MGAVLDVRAWLAVGLLAAFGASVTYVNIVLPPTSRWLALCAMVALLMLRKELLIGLDGAVGRHALLLILLCVLSSFWSEVPQLTLMKSVGYAFTVVAYSAAGRLSVEFLGWPACLRVSAPVTVIGVIAILGGVNVESAQLQMNEYISLYRGLTANSNFLGILLLCSIPFALYLSLGLAGERRWLKILGWIVLAMVLVYLLKSYSRASVLAAIVLLFVLIWRTRIPKVYFAAAIAAAVSAYILMFDQSSVAQSIRDFAFKGNQEASSILESRQETWEESYQGAEAGGIFGLGFGVSYGLTEFKGGLSAENYGREKGNTGLAVVEEIGMIGFVLYIGFIISIMKTGASLVLKAQAWQESLARKIMLGLIIGLIVNSQFEAWFLSPGGVATAYFWTLVGALTHQGNIENAYD